MSEWSTFFAAVLGAAATLTGLIFVGVSISLTRILSLPRLPDRALSSLVVLTGLLTVSIFCLIPGQPTMYAGIEILITGCMVWMITFRLDRRSYLASEKEFRKLFLFNLFMTQVSVAPYIAAGILILVSGAPAILWLVPGIIFSFIKAVLDAWVLLVEIHR